MSDTSYKFTIADGRVTAMYELDNGVWRLESIDADETLTFDAATGKVTFTESYGSFLEVKVFEPAAAGGTWLRSDSYYTDLQGNPIDSMPEDEIEDEDGDGFDDDDMDHDGFENDDLSGGSGDDSIHCAGGDDSAAGGAGDDSISGGSGDDDLDGDIGDDSIYGGTGDDDLVGDDGHDRLGGGDGRDDLIGGAGNDTLDGHLGDDRLWGGSGRDTVRGGDGNDTIEAGDDSGNDVYSGGTGRDTVRFAGADDDIVVNLGLGTAASAGLGDLARIGSNTLSGIENCDGGGFDDRLVGNSGSNRLDGGRGDDTINGGAGGDVIRGGLGDDVLNGGADDVRDVIDVDSIHEARGDRVWNFQSGTDDLDLRGIDAHGGIAGNQAFVFGGSHATAHGVWATQTATGTLVFGDVNGDAVADFTITLVGTHGIVAGDVLL